MFALRIKDCWEISNGDLSTMPHNNPVRVSGNDAPTKYDDWNDVFPYETSNKVIYRNDSGSEREAAAAFYSEPEKWYHYVEFELTAPAKVWVGMGKTPIPVTVTGIHGHTRLSRCGTKMAEPVFPTSWLRMKTHLLNTTTFRVSA